MSEQQAIDSLEQFFWWLILQEVVAPRNRGQQRHVLGGKVNRKLVVEEIQEALQMGLKKIFICLQESKTLKYLAEREICIWQGGSGFQEKFWFLFY